MLWTVSCQWVHTRTWAVFANAVQSQQSVLPYCGGGAALTWGIRELRWQCPEASQTGTHTVKDQARLQVMHPFFVTGTGDYITVPSTHMA